MINISTGLVAPPSVNVTDAIEIGENVLNDMSSFSPTSYKFSRTSVVKQIPDKSKISAKAIHPTLQNINTEIILQRLSTVGSEEQKKAALNMNWPHIQHPFSQITVS